MSYLDKIDTSYMKLYRQHERGLFTNWQDKDGDDGMIPNLTIQETTTEKRNNEGEMTEMYNYNGTTNI